MAGYQESKKGRTKLSGKMEFQSAFPPMTLDPPPPLHPQSNPNPPHSLNIRRTITNPIPQRPTPQTLHLEPRSPTVTAAPRVHLADPVDKYRQSCTIPPYPNRPRILNPCCNVRRKLPMSPRVDTDLSLSRRRGPAQCSTPIPSVRNITRSVRFVPEIELSYLRLYWYRLNRRRRSGLTKLNHRTGLGVMSCMLKSGQA